MFIPIRTDYRMRHRPWVNYAIIAANVVLYAMGYNASSDLNSLRIDNYMLHSDLPQVHQFISSVFLHASLVHIIGNMVFLWVFGNAVNDRMGHAAYLAFYLAGGVLASVGFLLLEGTGPLLGASGAIAAVTGAYLVLLPRVRVTVLVWLFYLLMPMEISSLYFLAFQFVFNLVATYSLHTVADSNVAYAAHSTGYVFGIAVAAAVLATRLLARDPYDLLNLIHAHERRRQYRRMVAHGFDPFGANQRIEPGSPKWVQSKPVEPTPPKNDEIARQIAQRLTRGELPQAMDLYDRMIQTDPQAVLPRQNQLDLANYLMSSNHHAQAARAYERFLQVYPDDKNAGDIYLMLGILYGRYLNQEELAQKYLAMALQTLSDGRKIELARNMLEELRDEG